MATSGSTNFTINRDEIIRQALLNLRVVDPAIAIGAQDISDGALGLNLMIKAWQTDGVFLWLNEEVCLHQQYNTQYYSLGTDHCALLSDSFKTQLASDAAAAATEITVDDDDDIEDGDYIGIELDSGTIQWTTVNGAPSENVVTLTDALTGAATTDRWAFSYTSKISRPLQIIEARVRDTNDVDIPLNICTSRNEFFHQTDKTTTGEVLDVYYEPLIGNGRLYTWPVAGTTDVTDRIIMTVQRVIEDLDTSANNFDGPVEALEALIWNLSARQAPQYGVDLNMGKGITIARAAGAYYARLKSFYTDREPFQMRP